MANSHVALLSFPGFRPSWAADGPYCKNESAILNVILPHLRATYGVGPISLLGFAQGGARSPFHAFRRTAAYVCELACH